MIENNFGVFYNDPNDGRIRSCAVKAAPDSSKYTRNCDYNSALKIMAEIKALYPNINYHIRYHLEGCDAMSTYCCEGSIIHTKEVIEQLMKELEL